MFDIYFVAGADDRWNYPKAVTTAGLAHQFAVIQHSDPKLNDDTTADPAMVRAMAAFLSAYDAEADVMAADEWEDIGQRERPLAAYMADWEVTAEADRDPPMAVVVRKAGKAVAYMLVEPWYGVGGPWPFADSCTYTFFTDRDIGPELEAYLRGHPDAARWNISPTRLTAEVTRNYPARVKREKAVIPGRRWEAAWIALVQLAAPALVLSLPMVLSRGPKHHVIILLAFISLVCGFIACGIGWQFRNVGVALSWEGIRKGTGRRAKFIAWKDARLIFGGGGVKVRSGKRTLSVHSSLFHHKDFWNFFCVIAQDLKEAGLARAAQGPNVTAPAYRLSDNDLKAYVKSRARGVNASPRIGQLTGAVLFCAPMMAFILRQIGGKAIAPPALQALPVYLAASFVCTLALAILASVADSLSDRRERWKHLRSMWFCLQDFTLSISEAGIVSRTIGYEDFVYWDEIDTVAATPELILFIDKKVVIFALPKRIFPSPEDADAFYQQALTFKRAFVA